MDEIILSACGSDLMSDVLAFVKEKGIDIKSEISQPNPHIKFFYILDPNGLKIQLVENI